MKIIDISRELLSAPVYPGDCAPVVTHVTDVNAGDAATVSDISACLHNGTHLDAPCHFFQNADDVNAYPLDTLCGECFVAEAAGVLTGEDMEKLLSRRVGIERLLLKGGATLSQSAAFVLCDAGVKLVGVEDTWVAAPAETAVVHRKLLAEPIAILENLDLSEASEGWYLLFAAPIKISGADGAPVRALLLERN